MCDIVAPVSYSVEYLSEAAVGIETRRGDNLHQMASVGTKASRRAPVNESAKFLDRVKKIEIAL